MEVNLTVEQQTLIRRAVAEGRYTNSRAAVKDALNRWADIEQARKDLIASLVQAEVDFSAGRCRRFTAGTGAFAETLKREVRTRRQRG